MIPNPTSMASSKVKAGSLAGLLVVALTLASTALEMDLIVDQNIILIIGWLLHTLVAWWKTEFNPSPSAIEEVERRHQEWADAMDA